MAYNTDQDPYLDLASGVFVNLLGIVTAEDLAEAEASLSAAAIASLDEQPVVGTFGLAHLQAIHRRLFGDLYAWAGEPRTVEMTKGATRFANPDFIAKAATALFDELHAEGLLRDLSDDVFAERLTHYYSEVNILHPFREGNGRTQRAFFTMLAALSNRDIAWDQMNQEDNLAASIAAYAGDESELVRLLGSLITSLRT